MPKIPRIFHDFLGPSCLATLCEHTGFFFLATIFQKSISPGQIANKNVTSIHRRQNLYLSPESHPTTTGWARARLLEFKLQVHLHIFTKVDFVTIFLEGKKTKAPLVGETRRRDSERVNKKILKTKKGNQKYLPVVFVVFFLVTKLSTQQNFRWTCWHGGFLHICFSRPKYVVPSLCLCLRL